MRTRTFLLPVPANDANDEIINSIVAIAVAMETVGEPRCYDAVAARVAKRAILLMQGRDR